MKTILRKIGVPIIAIGLIGSYILIAGRTGSCSACSAIIGTVGLSVETSNPDAPLAEGDSIPEGTLYTDFGSPYVLEEELSGKPAVLIFYRGGWCPYCSRHLSALAEVEEALDSAGFTLLAISPDRPEVLRQKEKLADLSYTLLSDSSMQVSSRFGIAFKVEDKLVSKYKDSYGIDIEADSGETHHLLPHPSVYIVDADGIIRFAYVNENYKVRLEPEKILSTAKAILNLGNQPKPAA
ncbi:MAG: peroxiredoxin-like family protein [Puniceicoccaceae bacterium]